MATARSVIVCVRKRFPRFQNDSRVLRFVFFGRLFIWKKLDLITHDEYGILRVQSKSRGSLFYGVMNLRLVIQIALDDLHSVDCVKHLESLLLNVLPISMVPPCSWCVYLMFGIPTTKKKEGTSYNMLSALWRSVWGSHLSERAPPNSLYAGQQHWWLE